MLTRKRKEEDGRRREQKRMMDIRLHPSRGKVKIEKEIA